MLTNLRKIFTYFDILTKCQKSDTDKTNSSILCEIREEEKFREILQDKSEKNVHTNKLLSAAFKQRLNSQNLLYQYK